MKYGVVFHGRYETWMEEFDTLEDAMATLLVDRKRVMTGPGVTLTLVKIMSTHREGDLA